MNYKIGDVIEIPHGRKDNIFYFKVKELNSEGHVVRMPLMSKEEIEEYKLTKVENQDNLVSS